MRTFLITAAAFLVVTGTAYGARAATAPEIDEMRTAVAAGIETGQVNRISLAPECTSGQVSTINADWGRLNTVPSCNEDQGVLGVLMIHDAESGWDWYETIYNEPHACLTTDAVPAGVEKELHTCVPPITVALCWDGSANRVRARLVHPGTCNTLGPVDSFSEAGNFSKLKWKSWGKYAASATGYSLGFHLGDPRVKVRIVASRRRALCEGDYVYTRWKVTSKYGTSVLHFDKCETSSGGE